MTEHTLNITLPEMHLDVEMLKEIEELHGQTPAEVIRSAVLGNAEVAIRFAIERYEEIKNDK